MWCRGRNPVKHGTGHLKRNSDDALYWKTITFLKNKTINAILLPLTSQTVQWKRVSTWCLHSLQVYTKRSWLWLCSSTNIHIELHMDLLRELNSRCLSRASVRKASRPSMRSHAIRGSGSTIGGKAFAMGPAISRMTKNTLKKKTKQCILLFVIVTS